MNCANFGVDNIMNMNSGRGTKVEFPLYFVAGPYTNVLLW